MVVFDVVVFVMVVFVMVVSHVIGVVGIVIIITQKSSDKFKQLVSWNTGDCVQIKFSKCFLYAGTAQKSTILDLNILHNQKVYSKAKLRYTISQRFYILLGLRGTV